MNRRELCVLLKQNFPHFKTKDIENLLKSAEQLICKTAFDGAKVTLIGFGTFSSKVVPAHKKAIALQGDKKVVDVPEKVRLVFKPSKQMIRKEGQDA